MKGGVDDVTYVPYYPKDVLNLSTLCDRKRKGKKEKDKLV